MTKWAPLAAGDAPCTTLAPGAEGRPRQAFRRSGRARRIGAGWRAVGPVAVDRARTRVSISGGGERLSRCGRACARARGVVKTATLQWTSAGTEQAKRNRSRGRRGGDRRGDRTEGRIGSGAAVCLTDSVQISGRIRPREDPMRPRRRPLPRISSPASSSLATGSPSPPATHRDERYGPESHDGKHVRERLLLRAPAPPDGTSRAEGARGSRPGRAAADVRRGDGYRPRSHSRLSSAETWMRGHLASAHD